VFRSIGSLRKSIGLSALFFFLTSTFLILAIGAYCSYPLPSVGINYSHKHTGFLNHKVNIIKIGGYFGVITALIAYYCGLADMLGPNDIISLPTGKHD
jgi:succinate-acetate transporter protein